MQVVCCSATAAEGCGSDECVELTEREFSVCALVCRAGGPVSFNELKRETSLHQEILSRIMRRLTIHGAIEKVDGGYRGHCIQRPAELPICLRHQGPLTH